MNPENPHKDDVIGNWRLVRELGQGGNGDVWLAQDATGKQVALKFLKKKHLQDGGNKRKIARFRTEINFLYANKDRPGILPIIDSNMPEKPSLQILERPWYTTPLCKPLREAQQENYSLERVVCDIESLANTLAQLHAENITHRDIKPENLFWLNNMPVLGDFGLVDMPDKPDVTDKTEIMGPLHYVAPEMLHDAADVSAKSADVYSLAKTLWVLATMQTYPIQGEQRITQSNLTLGAYVNHPRSRMIDFLLDRATRYSLEERPTMEEFKNELSFWLKPISSISITPQVDWDEAARVLQTLQDVYNQECAQRAIAAAIHHEIDVSLSKRMVQLMEECNRKLRVANTLGGGGIEALWKISPNATCIGNASIHLHSPYPNCGVLIGWVGVQSVESENLHILGAVAMRNREHQDILWKIEVTALIGTAKYENEIEGVFDKVREQFYKAIPVYIRRLQESN